MITIIATFCIFVSVRTSDIKELQLQTVKYGENVTIKCDQNFVKGRLSYLSWFKQSFGKLPQSVVRSSIKNTEFRFSKTFEHRFSLTANEETFDLNIINTIKEDAGTYYCMRVKENATEFGSGTFLLFSDEKPKKRNLTEIDVKKGESVTIQCLVPFVTSSCSEDHSVSWFKHGSEESHPGIIYTHVNSDDQCKKSSETDSTTQSCVYKLPKTNLSLSDTGTYYCAVAACGEILFGNGTKLNVTDDDIWIVAALTTSNVISVIVIVVLVVLLCKNQWKGCFSDSPSHTNPTENEDALNYAALNFAKRPPPSKTSRVKESHDIYSQVKVR